MPGYDARKYVSVAERIQAATHDDDPRPRNVVRVERVDFRMLNEVMGMMTYEVELRTGEKAQGTSSFRLDLTGKSAQSTNPIEDGETSAVGRALAMLGYHTDRGMASQEEMLIARARENAPSSYQAAQMQQSAPEEISVGEARRIYFKTFGEFLGGRTPAHIADAFGVSVDKLGDLNEKATWQKLYKRTQRAVSEAQAAAEAEALEASEADEGETVLDPQADATPVEEVALAA